MCLNNYMKSFIRFKKIMQVLAMMWEALPFRVG